MGSKKEFKNVKEKQKYVKKIENLYDNISLITTDLQEIISSSNKCEMENNFSHKEKKNLFDNVFSQIYITKKKKHKKDEKILENQKNFLDFSKISIFLLISSFLAYYNPSNTDSRYFTLDSNHKRVTKRKAKENLNPSPFTLSRLFKIFFFISSQFFSDFFYKPHESPLLLSQVNDLVQQKYLTLMSSKENIDEIKYKCNCEIYFVQELSSQISFPLLSFLHQN